MKMSQLLPLSVSIHLHLSNLGLSSLLRNLPIINCTSLCLVQISGIIPASKSIPFLYTNRLTTTIVTAEKEKWMNT